MPLKQLQIAVEGVAPSMWLRGSFIDCSWPTSIPMTRGMPRESMKLSEPRIGSRADIRVRIWSACSRRCSG